MADRGRAVLPCVDARVPPVDIPRPTVTHVPFPSELGLTAERPLRDAELSVRALGAVRTWTYRDGGSRLTRGPVRGAWSVAVLVQIEGRALVKTAGRSCALGAGDVTFLAASLPAAVETVGTSLQAGLELAGGGLPGRALRLAGQRSDRCSASARVLAEAVRALWENTPTPSEVRAVITCVEACADALSMSAHAAGRTAGRAAELAASLPAENITPVALAHALGMSRRQLDRAFVRETGWTAAAWISEERLQRAAALLAAGAAERIGVFGVGLECGFKEAAHFSRAFRTRFGVPPSSWPQHPPR